MTSFLLVNFEHISYVFLVVLLLTLNKEILAGNQLVILVFRKATFSVVFINFKSFLFVAYKFGLVYIHFNSSFLFYLFFIWNISWRNGVIKRHFQKEWISSIFLLIKINNFLESCLFLKGSLTLLTKSKSY